MDYHLLKGGFSRETTVYWRGTLISMTILDGWSLKRRTTVWWMDGLKCTALKGLTRIKNTVSDFGRSQFYSIM